MPKSSIVMRSAEIMDVVCGEGAPLGFSRIVALTGLPKSSVHRLLSILLEERQLAFDSDRQTYQPGPRLLTWAAGALQRNNLPELCTAAMDDLNAQTGNHVCLSVLDGGSVLHLRTVDQAERFRPAPRVGERSPAHVCALGKVLLAYLRPQRREALLGDLVLERYTEHSITGRDVLEEELAHVRENGFAQCDREEFLAVVGIAAPIFDQLGDAIAALSLWNVAEDQDLNVLRGFADTLCQTTASLSARLGYRETVRAEVT